LTSLQILDLFSNQITSIDANTFKGSFYLKYLNLESNQIISFDRNALEGFYYLEKVCWAQNPILILVSSSIYYVCDGNPKCTVYLTTCSLCIPKKTYITQEPTSY
jgi:hypothetical protein